MSLLKTVAAVLITISSLSAFAVESSSGSSAGIGNDANTRKIMNELGMGLDIAENNLRILLNKPANGTPFKSYEVSCKNQLAAAMTLLNYEMRHPGYLQGRYGKADWAQYNKVRELFEQAAEKYDFYYKDNKTSKSSSSQGTR
ncbi:hypothetical protein [Bdellovibrio svalbardensis]|uniref:Uncharacterized protein n=1 Tax=Bdellovibrio svalbardensis TaxID=2972972 RepID=A0ABT6DQ85_9BACT|nr:hypothetical protein [Bdellovibrio svalbardensis]MDG0817308.1 hypothetical protein [Bdellovibrio svalbardensis]